MLERWTQPPKTPISMSHCEVTGVCAPIDQANMEKNEMTLDADAALVGDALVGLKLLGAIRHAKKIDSQTM